MKISNCSINGSEGSIFVDGVDIIAENKQLKETVNTLEIENKQLKFQLEQFQND